MNTRKQLTETMTLKTADVEEYVILLSEACAAIRNLWGPGVSVAIDKIERVQWPLMHLFDGTGTFRTIDD